MLFDHVQLRGGQTNATFCTTRLNMSSKTVNKGMWRENYFCCARASTTEYNKVAWGGQTSTTYNIAENKRNVSCNICLVKSLIAIKLHTTRYNTIKHDTTRYNTIKHDTTRYNKMAKRVQHFIKHQSCMMYEMLYSFGRGFKTFKIIFLSPELIALPRSLLLACLIQEIL